MSKDEFNKSLQITPIKKKLRNMGKMALLSFVLATSSCGNNKNIQSESIPIVTEIPQQLDPIINFLEGITCNRAELNDTPYGIIQAQYLSAEQIYSNGKSYIYTVTRNSTPYIPQQFKEGNFLPVNNLNEDKTTVYFLVKYLNNDKKIEFDSYGNPFIRTCGTCCW